MTMVINGDSGITFPDNSVQSIAGGYTFKNRIINGDMRIDQRNAGASKTFTAGSFGYTLDRWTVGYALGGSVIVQRVAGPNSYDYAVQIQPQTGNTQTNYEQVIELNNCVDLSGTAVTASGKVYVDSTASGSAQLYYYYYPTNGGTQTFVSLGSVSLTAGQYVSFSKTFTCPTLFPSTASDPSSRGLGLILEMDNAAGRTFKWTGVQLEKGSTATSFDYRPYNTELALCQRYYETSAFVGFNYFGGAGAGWNVLNYGFKVEKRATPSIVFSGMTYATSNSIVPQTVTTSILNATVTATGPGGGAAFGTFAASAEL